MAESSGNKGLGHAPEQMSTETRLLLAFLLMGAIMFLTPYFFKTQAPPPNTKKSTQAAVESAAAPQPAPAQVHAETAAAQTAPPTAPLTQAQTQPPLVIKTDMFQVTFSNQGANVRSWLLRKSLADGKPLELVNTKTTVEDPYPFNVYMADHKDLAGKLNTSAYQQTVDLDGLGVAFDYSDG